MHQIIQTLTPGTPLKEAMKAAKQAGISIKTKRRHGEVVFSIPGEPCEVVSKSKGDLGKSTLSRLQKWSTMLEQESQQMKQPWERMTKTETVIAWVAENPGRSRGTIKKALDAQHDIAPSSSSSMLSRLIVMGTLEELDGMVFPKGWIKTLAMAEKKKEEEDAKAEPAVPQRRATDTELSALQQSLKDAITSLETLSTQIQTILSEVEKLVLTREAITTADKDVLEAANLLSQSIQDLVRLRNEDRS